MGNQKMRVQFSAVQETEPTEPSIRCAPKLLTRGAKRTDDRRVKLTSQRAFSSHFKNVWSYAFTSIYLFNWWPTIQDRGTFLGTFAKLRKATINLVIYFCPSACNSSALTRLPRNLIFEDSFFSKIYREN